jgi:hypothetical protein
MRLALHLVGAVEDLLEQLARELLALDYVPQTGTYGHEKTSFAASRDRT